MNIYWPVYKNLESEFLKLMYDIHINDHQLNVYSSKISDLILRSVVEIESLSKELYVLNNGPKKDTSKIKYDYDAIQFLIDTWKIDRKIVIISSKQCFLTNIELSPFLKNETKTNKKNQTFSWNNAYQNIKHNRSENIHMGSIKYLFDSMSALYLLNLYFSNININLGRDLYAKSISPSFGSDIFSIYIFPHQGPIDKEKYIRDELSEKDFQKSVYFVDVKKETIKTFTESFKKLNQTTNEIALKNEKIKEYLKNKDLTKLTRSWIVEAVGVDEETKIIREAYRISPIRGYEIIEYEAILNKNQV